jgi:chemotaxis protein MotB
VPVSPGSAFSDNWELSQARALSVVRYLIDEQGLPASRLAGTGFGEFQPVDPGGTPEALARNRRIELKLTER